MMNEITKAFVRFVYDPRETFNPACEPHEYNKRWFSTDKNINGAYFKSKTQNNYYKIIPANMTIRDIVDQELYRTGQDYRPAPRLLDHLEYYSKKFNVPPFDPTKECLVKLEFEDDKEYFVENYQDINTNFNKTGVRFTVMTDVVDYDTLVAKLKAEKFEPIPNA